MLIIRHHYHGKLMKTYRFNGPVVTVGSSRFAHIRLLGANVSPQHAAFERHGRRKWTLMDFNMHPATFINGAAITEAAMVEKCMIKIGDHELEFIPARKVPLIFDSRFDSRNAERAYSTPFTTSIDKQLVILKTRRNVVESHVLSANHPITFGPTADCMFQLQVEKKTLEPVKFTELTRQYTDRVGPYEVIRVPVADDKSIESEKMIFEKEMRKPVGFSALGLIVFLIVFIGIPMPKQDQKPESNVYTRMIFDSKILKQKRAQLTSTGSRRGVVAAGGGNVAENQKQQTQAASKTITNLRSSGLQSVIGKIAARASQSARLFASLGAMPSADASVGPVGGGAQLGKAVSLGAGGTGGKEFKIAGIGTGGKGGKSGSYREGVGLGTGSIGSGDVGVDDEESVVEGGLDKEVIAAVIKEHLGQIRYCYERQLSGNPNLLGKVKVRFQIGADGTVGTENIGQSTLKNAVVEECILRRIAKWKFPKPKGGTQVNVSYPFLFKSVN